MKKLISLVFIVVFAFSFVIESNADVINTVVVDTPQSFKVVERLNFVKLSWKRNPNVTGYTISRSTDRDVWHKIATISDNSVTKYYDYSAADEVVYYYSVRAFTQIDNKNHFSKPADAKAVFFGINFYASTFENSVTLNWDAVSGASGYEIYMSTDNCNFKRIKTIKNKKRDSYTKTKITPNLINYSFYLKVYKLKGGVKTYLHQSETVTSNDMAAIVNGSVGEPKKSFKTYNVQGEKASVAYKVSISAADKAIIKNFDANYNTDDMSPYDRIWTAFQFIHRKTTYASGGLYSQIGNSTYVDSIFNKRIGQCVQYNGAMLEYLANLGMNVKLLMGYRGTSPDNKWQHFWGQVKLSNGKTYVMETGNYGNDGSWYYFFTPYSRTKKYLKCNKYVSGIQA